MTIDWNQFLASPVALIVSLILAVLLLGGCADPQQSQTAMDFLKQGQAQGTLTMTSGGSPLQVGSKQVFFVGPGKTHRSTSTAQSTTAARTVD
jgi:hypothetical protein